MSEQTNGERADDAPSGGVFGRLPASRPGTRSPRRQKADASDDEQAPRERAAAASASGAEPASAPRAEPERQAPTPPPRPRAARSGPKTGQSAEGRGAPEPEQVPAQSGRALEDLAWAGIAVAAEAATLGVRLATRALGAVRDGVDRR